MCLICIIFEQPVQCTVCDRELEWKCVVMELMMWVLFVWLDSPRVVCAPEETWLYVHSTICMHVTYDCLCASIHCAICMHVMSDCFCASIHCAICMHVTSDCLCACLHRTICKCCIWLCASKVLLCCSNNLTGVVIALNCITTSVVFLLMWKVLTPWTSPFLVTEVVF